eukprot:2190494-Rhodomonas_salina.1
MEGRGRGGCSSRWHAMLLAAPLRPSTPTTPLSRSASFYGANTAVHGGNAAVFGGRTAVFGGKSAVYGGETDECGGVRQRGPADSERSQRKAADKVNLLHHQALLPPSPLPPSSPSSPPSPSSPSAPAPPLPSLFVLSSPAPSRAALRVLGLRRGWGGRGRRRTRRGA